MATVTIVSENVYIEINGERHHIGTLCIIGPRHRSKAYFKPMGVVGHMIFDRPITTLCVNAMKSKIENYTLYNLDGSFRGEGERDAVEVPQVEDF